MLEIDKVYCGDCLELMKQIPDKSIDLILTDPPYGKRYLRPNGYGFGVQNNYSDEWDSQKIDKPYFDGIFRIGENVVLFGANYYTNYLPPSNCWIVWDKKGDANFVNPFADCELAYTTFNRVVKKYSMLSQGFIRVSKDKILHPTQKPTELFEKILRDFTNEGDLVCDPFLGSGTTAIACINTNRHFIGMELSPEYVDICNKRIDEARRDKAERDRQIVMF